MKRARVVTIGFCLLLGTASFGGETADLSWPDTQGKAQSLDNYKGKIVVLNWPHGAFRASMRCLCLRKCKRSMKRKVW
jgi:hypothetical protein